MTKLTPGRVFRGGEPENASMVVAGMIWTVLAG